MSEETKEKSPEQKAIEGWWKRVTEQLKKRGHKITVEAVKYHRRGPTVDTNTLVDGIDINLILSPRSCENDWAGKSCQRAHITLGIPGKKFFEKKTGFDVLDLTEKVEAYLKVALKEKAERDDIQARVAFNVSRETALNKKYGGKQMSTYDTGWGVHSYGKDELQLKVNVNLTTHQADEILEACQRILGTDVNKEKEK